MSTEIEKKPDETLAVAKPREGQIAVVVSVTCHGQPQDAEELAKGALTALRILMPQVKVGE